MIMMITILSIPSLFLPIDSHGESGALNYLQNVLLMKSINAKVHRMSRPYRATMHFPGQSWKNIFEVIRDITLYANAFSIGQYCL